jgi:CPA1 family monovalent cation:H+ antiporter
MTAFQTLAVLLTVAAAFAYVNHRWIRLPAEIALMAMGIGVSTILLVLDRIGWLHVAGVATAIVERVDLDDTLLHGMLGVLLFAGALHIDLAELRRERVAVGFLAIGSTVLSTVVIGWLAKLALATMGIELPLVTCLLFGALISPTDPIAVLGILKGARVPRSMEIQIAGESLFNDGVGVVVFLTILGVASGGEHVTAAHVAGLFFREAVGGAAFGFATGYATFLLLRSIDHYQTELLLTLALVLGGYALAEALHISAPLAAVVAGLVIGNHGRALGMSDVTRDRVDKFWSLVDYIMNAILFVLLGFELISISLTGRAVLAGLLAVPLVLVARFVSVAGPLAVLSRVVRFAPGSVWVLTWGGLRGGISVALALSIPGGSARDLIVAMTYFVVVFSVFAQGLTLSRLARRWGGDPAAR